MVKPRLHDTAGCQTGLYNRFDKHGLTTGWMFVYTTQPVVKPVVKRVWQPVWQPCSTNSCSFNRLSNRVVPPVWQRVWQPVVSCIQTFTRLSSLTTGCI